MVASTPEIGSFQLSNPTGAFHTAEVTQVATPVMVPSSGAVVSGTTVSITCTTPSSTIYYTTDGSTPDNTDTEYTIPISITTGVTIKAIAVATGFTDSNVASETYTISGPAPVIAQPIIIIIT